MFISDIQTITKPTWVPRISSILTLYSYKTDMYPKKENKTDTVGLKQEKMDIWVSGYDLT